MGSTQLNVCGIHDHPWRLLSCRLISELFSATPLTCSSPLINRRFPASCSMRRATRASSPTA